jgi:hypothetical protein
VATTTTDSPQGEEDEENISINLDDGLSAINEQEQQ